MVVVGVDIGAETTKVAVVEDGNAVLAQVLVETGFNQKVAAQDAINQALQMAKVKPEDVRAIVTTGSGSDVLDYATKQVSPNVAAARGAYWFFPSASTVIDVGAEEARAAKLQNGKAKDFVINEKCAAGAGIFVKAMARALELPIDEFAKISLESTEHIPMNAQCAIFAESEVVSLIHEEVPRADIVRAVHDAMAERIYGMANRVGLEKDIVLIGGMAKNTGFVTSLKSVIGMDIAVPDEPQYVCAIGAALSAPE